MNLQNLDLQKYEQLELDRANTMNDPKFQNWAKELNVSQSYEDRSGIIRANELNNQYDFSKPTKGDSIIHSIVSLLNPTL
jgi:hypothetical protein